MEEYIFTKVYRKVKNGAKSSKIAAYTVPKDAERVLALQEGDVIMFTVKKMVAEKK